MEHKLTPLARILSRHRDDLDNDDELQVGETQAELMKRLGLKRWGEEPIKAEMPPLPMKVSDDEVAKWAARFIRQMLIGYTDLELAALAGVGNSTEELAQIDTRREMSRLRNRLTKFANRWDPVAGDDPEYLAHLEQIRARHEAPRKGRHP